MIEYFAPYVFVSADIPSPAGAAVPGNLAGAGNPAFPAGCGIDGPVTVVTGSRGPVRTGFGRADVLLVSRWRARNDAIFASSLRITAGAGGPAARCRAARLAATDAFIRASALPSGDRGGGGDAGRCAGSFSGPLLIFPGGNGLEITRSCAPVTAETGKSGAASTATDAATAIAAATQARTDHFTARPPLPLSHNPLPGATSQNHADYNPKARAENNERISESKQQKPPRSRSCQQRP